MHNFVFCEIMRLGILSDIHSNIDALEAVFYSAKNKHIDAWISLGDNVGYLPWANEVLGILRDRQIPWVIGNHEVCLREALFGKTMYMASSPAQKSVTYTAAHMGNFEKSLFLAQMEKEKYVLSGSEVQSSLPSDQLVFAHCNPFFPKAFNMYIESWSEANYDIFQNPNSQKLTFVGHSHKPFIYTNNSISDMYSGVISTSYSIVGDEKIVVVVPSVGLPRDNNSQTGYVIFDSDARVIEIERLDYDVARTCAKLREMTDFDIAHTLCERLECGR
jgi:predicted phosphodiesterase